MCAHFQLKRWDIHRSSDSTWTQALLRRIGDSVPRASANAHGRTTSSVMYPATDGNLGRVWLHFGLGWSRPQKRILREFDCAGTCTGSCVPYGEGAEELHKGRRFAPRRAAILRERRFRLGSSTTRSKDTPTWWVEITRPSARSCESASPRKCGRAPGLAVDDHLGTGSQGCLPGWCFCGLLP